MLYLRKISLVWIVGVMAWYSGYCLADGKMYPAKGIKAVPNIPHQRAIVRFRDGQETLIVESSFTGEGTDFGWIVPVPALPTSYQAVSPGFLKTIDMAVQPQVTVTFRHDGSLTKICLVLVFLWSGIVIFGRCKSITALTLLLIVFLLIGIFVPSLSHVRSSVHMVAGVSVMSSQTVGGYDIVSLQADMPDALNQWLNANGFVTLPVVDQPIVDQYIQDGWQFVAAKLHRTEQGLSSPHPLAIEFPAEAPVYPMKLTGTVGQEMALDLFVIADQRYEYPSLSVEVCNQYKQGLYERRYQEPELPGYGVSDRGPYIMHSKSSKWLWDGCVITRLSATLSAQDMTQDFYLKVSPYEKTVKHYYGYQYASKQATFIGTWCFIVVIVLLTARALRLNQRTIKSVLTCTGVAITVALGVGLFQYVSLDKVDANGVYPRHTFNRQRNDFYSAYENILKDHSDLNEYESIQIETLFNEYFRKNEVVNIYDHQPLCVEESPGNCRVVEKENGLYMRFYDESCFPLYRDLPF